MLCGTIVTWAETGKVTIAWDPITDSRLGGYTVHWGLIPGSLLSTQNTTDTQLTFQLEVSKKYYFAVNAYDTQGNAGYWSSQVSAVVKTAAEAGLIQFIPHVVESAELRSNLGINNVSDDLATVTVRMLDKDGVEIATGSYTVPARGLKQVNRIVRDLLGTPDAPGFEGYLRLESNQPIQAWASEINNLTNDPAFAAAKTSGASRVLVKSAAEMGEFRSSLVVVNIGNQAAMVTITMWDVEGKILGQMKDLEIPAQGFYSTHDVLNSLGVTNNYGPLEVLSTNGQPLVVVSRVYSSSGTSGFFEGQPLQ